jgi:hypothetical protein
MATTIKISDEQIVSFVREESKIMSRSAGEQATHWMRLGRNLERSGLVNFERIRQVLSGQLNPDALTTREEEAVAVEMFDEAMLNGSMMDTSEQEIFYAQRKDKGLGVGMDAEGNLTYASDLKK